MDFKEWIGEVRSGVAEGSLVRCRKLEIEHRGQRRDAVDYLKALPMDLLRTGLLGTKCAGVPLPPLDERRQRISDDRAFLCWFFTRHAMDRDEWLYHHKFFGVMRFDEDSDGIAALAERLFIHGVLRYVVVRHCLGNMEASEIEHLRSRWSFGGEERLAAFKDETDWAAEVFDVLAFYGSVKPTFTAYSTFRGQFNDPTQRDYYFDGLFDRPARLSFMQRCWRVKVSRGGVTHDEKVLIRLMNERLDEIWARKEAAGE